MVSFEISSKDPVRIPDELLDEVRKYRRQCKSIRVTISPVFTHRTSQQNAMFHAKVNRIARMTGADRAYIKKSVKDVAMTMGYPPAIGDDGELELDASGNIVAKSTSKASIEEMKILIDALDQWCFDNGIDIEEVWR